MINFFVVCWSSHTGKNWLWNHGVRWQGNNLFSRAELFARNIACVAAAGSLARAKFWYRSCEAVRRMGRRRFEIRAFGARSTEQNNSASFAGGTRHVSVCCYDNSCDLFTVDPRGLTKFFEERCLCSTQGGYSKFQVTGLIEWRQKLKPPKFPRPKINPRPPPPPKKKNIPCRATSRALKVSRKQNKFGCTLFAEARSRETRTLPRIVILFWIPKKSLLKLSHPQKIHAKFS